MSADRPPEAPIIMMSTPIPDGIGPIRPAAMGAQGSQNAGDRLSHFAPHSNRPSRAGTPKGEGTGKRFFCAGDAATLVRARQHKSNAVRRHLQHLQGRRAFEDRIVCCPIGS
jgi:hypothetical protein